MCGIAGLIDYSGDTSTAFDVGSVLDKQKHRGPDDRGFYCDENVSVGMDRLSIIDLDHGAQPMFNEGRDIVVIFNGEIYNFRELRQKLIKKGYFFKTDSDTEVLVRLYEDLGIDLVHEINGMFGIFIYDKRKRRCYLVRDRLGIKPLFYTLRNGALYFASELHSLSSINTLEKKVDISALYQYLKYSYIHYPYTIFENVRKLEPGSYLEITDKGTEINKYWEVPTFADSDKVKSAGEAVEELNELLASSIEYRLISDVPLAAFLSGGLDSSTTVWYAAQNRQKLDVVTIGYSQDPHNDRHFAKLLAEKLDVNHHIIDADKSSFRYIPEIPGIMGEPFGDVGLMPTLELCELVKNYCKVVLTGEGSDELFGGYHKYKALNLMDTFHIGDNLGGLLRNRIFNKLSNAKPLNYAALKNTMKLSYHESYLPIDVPLSDLGFRKTDENSIRENLEYYDPILRDKRLQENGSLVDMMQYYDLSYRLPEKMLSRTDRATMHASIEGRVPFLDHRIVEFSRRLDSSLRNTLGESKLVLKKLMRGKLPKEIIKRRKFGMPMPFTGLGGNNFFGTGKGQDKRMLNNYLDENCMLIRSKKSNFQSGRLMNMEYNLNMLNLWLKNYVG